MELFISGEIDSTIGEKYRVSINKISSEVNRYLENKKYGAGLKLWGFIGIVMKPGLLGPEFFKEIKRYRKSKEETEFRLKIDYDQVVKADEKDTSRLICESILRSIEIARAEFKIPNFDLDIFEADIRECFKKQGWVE